MLIFPGIYWKVKFHPKTKASLLA